MSRVSPDGSTVELVAEHDGARDLDWDENGNMYISGGGTIARIAAGATTPVEVASDIGSLRNCRVYNGYLYVSQIWDGQISRFEITPDGLGDQEVYAELDTPVSFEFDENGTLYWARVSTFQDARSFYGKRLKGYFIPKIRSVDIDTPEDLKIARIYAPHLLPGEPK